MVFTLLIAADIHQTKLNYELDFSAVPTLADLQRRVHEVFGEEHRARRPSAVPPAPFAIERIQVFDENVELWVDLLSSTQLTEYAQLYVFQPETAWHREVQSKLPAAVKPPAAAPASPPRQAAAPQLPLQGVPPALPPQSSAPAAHPISATLPAVPAPPAPPPPQIPYGSPAPHMPQHNISPYRTATPVVPAPSPPVAVWPSSGAAGAARGADLSRGEKALAVLSEFAPRGGPRTVGREAFSQGLQRLRVELPAAAMADLFARADADGDGIISPPEFQRFAERYPTLVDALHFRLQEDAIDARQQEAIEAAHRVLDQLRQAEAEVRQSAAQAAGDSAALEARVATAQDQIAAAERSERDAAAALEGAQRETHRVRQEAAGRVAEMQGHKEEERRRMQAVQEAEREVEGAEQRIAAQDQAVAAAEDRLRELERMVQEQRREVDAQKEHAQRLRDTAAQLQSRKLEAVQGVQMAARDAQQAGDRLCAVEQDLLRCQDLERDAAGQLAAAREGTAHRRQQRENEDRQLLAARQQEEHWRSREQEAGRAAEGQQELCRRLEQENRAHNETRARVEADERPLIEQEVRLRQARDQLEEQEARLKADCGEFAHRTPGRGLPGSPQRPSRRQEAPRRGGSGELDAVLHSGAPMHPNAARFLSATPQQHTPLPGGGLR
eukprot:TRINITY_DN7902_c0_g1_i1.p1 TRINITY_DN7902_c0_g1~~TRINITY_DN7902_c0_g1_i1.p1  ORF type:complete len:670 (+),score=253.90 TRINITY_DN7902_c0_g1_i1:89-2098(+)